jgi:hypothetical protein
LLQKLEECLEPRSREMLELPVMQVMYGLIEGLEQIQTLFGDARFDYAAVVGLAFASDEVALLHAIEQAGNVGIVRDHAVADAAAGQAIRLRAAKNAENIVLRGG